MNILVQPEILSKWISSYELIDSSDLDVNFRLSGNPKPIVSAHIGGRNVTVASTDMGGGFGYRILVEGISRDYCGENIRVDIVGYNRTISRMSKIKVLFTPTTPENMRTQYVNTTCMTVRWKAIRAGSCRTDYTLSYTLSDEIRNTTVSRIINTISTKLLLCFPQSSNASNLTLRVKSKVGGVASEFSPSLSVRLPLLKRPTTSNTVSVLFHLLCSFFCKKRSQL